ncbi:TetR/AcrR family transcriptional regulator [Vibrio algarum]|uniref:TetR-like C-terminal domain-containing protein n=1 Tax=Vibrio algarum TaxID=3020714 RepID=A0ABT4YTD9_9VIBR|nr:TetR-like C-terminal domain-containing protein [Vibrio sp. KJ40-1]MDB1124461.1 TetR-like C-terminal domain-containing protein [Vibrio sp. KJ40-1]
MARRNDHTREELIELTLQKVEEFLADHPHHDLSLRKVATQIGYVPSTLVNVFGSYNLLLLKVVARTVDELQLESSKALENSNSTKEALYNLAYCYHDFAQQNPYRWQLIFQHTMNGEELPEWQANRINNMTSILEKLVAILSPHKSFEEIVEASRVLWAGVHGITLLSVDDKFFTSSPIDGKALIENLLTNYLK